MGGKVVAAKAPAYGAGGSPSAAMAECWAVQSLLCKMAPTTIGILSVDEVLSPATGRKRWAISLRAEGVEKTVTVFVDSDNLSGNFPYNEALNKIAVFAR